MSFWDLFTVKTNDNTGHFKLHSDIIKMLPISDEKEQIKVACIAGLFARLAYVDMDIHPNEVDDMKQALSKWTDFSADDIDAITQLAISHIKQLAGLENHKYCEPLNKILNNDQKYQLLESLFQIAASDGIVEEIESQEIRLISRGLLLEQRHYIAAKASVQKYLGTLRP